MAQKQEEEKDHMRDTFISTVLMGERSREAMPKKYLNGLVKR
jgi:hypothetical protein